MTDPLARLRQAARQEQFLDVVSRDIAEARFRAHLAWAPLGEETVSLVDAIGRIIARDIVAPVDVPGFDRANVDGFALRAVDTERARDDRPRRLIVNAELLTPGTVPDITVGPGTATVIATGGMLPRGADAVLMVEHTDAMALPDGGIAIELTRPVVAGQFIAAAGSDLTRGETVLRAGQTLTSREIAMLAAVGLGSLPVWRRPRVAILSTGDELVPPGGVIRPGQVFDSNQAVLVAAVQELGGIAVALGILPDDEAALADGLARALAVGDIVLMSGGTSKGAGDLAHRVVARLSDPGIVVHGVALKPGKPLCLAVSAGRPVAILPGFPTSAIFTFHEFIAPVILAFGGRPAARPQAMTATLPMRIASELGRTEYVLAALTRRTDGGLAAYPVSKGSGAVTSFTQADGFFTVPALVGQVAAETTVEVTLLGAGLGAGLGPGVGPGVGPASSDGLRIADLVIIGSHCVGLDRLVGHLERAGIRVKALNVGSTGGLAAARRGECDLAGIHLLDPATDRYNTPFLSEDLTLLTGYGRLQGVVFRAADARLAGCASVADVLALVATDPSLAMVNRNPGSGTRILSDGLLGGARPHGYTFQAKSHNGVAAAVAQGRADWGLAIETVARDYGLGFIPVREENYDFVVPAARLERPAVRQFVGLLESSDMRAELRHMGFKIGDGKRVLF